MPAARALYLCFFTSVAIGVGASISIFFLDLCDLAGNGWNDRSELAGIGLNRSELV